MTDEERLAFLGIPPDNASLARLFTLSRADRSLVGERRGCVVQSALLRYPSAALAYLDQPPEALVSWMAHQLAATLRLRSPTTVDDALDHRRATAN